MVCYYSATLLLHRTPTVHGRRDPEMHCKGECDGMQAAGRGIPNRPTVVVPWPCVFCTEDGVECSRKLVL